MKENIEQLLKGLKAEEAPSDSFRKNARIRILNTVGSVPWYRKPRMWGYTVGTAAATVALSVGTVFAAQSSPPNSPLYPVKVFSENVALTLSPTKSIKTTVAQTIISRRVTEVEEVQKHGDKRSIEASITRLNAEVSSIQKRNDVSRDEIDHTISEHKEFIKEINTKHEEDRPHEDD